MSHAPQRKKVKTSLRYGQGLMAANDKRRVPIDLLLHELPTLPWSMAATDR